MLKVGITGGIGSGKSTVSRFFSELGVPVYDSDQRAKSLMQHDDSIIIKIKKRIFNRYKKNLENNPHIKIFNFSKKETPWSVDIYSNKINKIKKILKKNKIFTRDVYPPLNSQKIYKNYKGWIL